MICFCDPLASKNSAVDGRTAFALRPSTGVALGQRRSGVKIVRKVLMEILTVSYARPRK